MNDINAITFAELRRRDLLAEVNQARLGRLAALAHRCQEVCCPTGFRRLLAALPFGGRATAAC